MNIPLDRIDAGTTAVATLVRELRAWIDNTPEPGLTAEHADLAMARLDAIAGNLEAAGKNPAEPFPVIPSLPPLPPV